MKHRMHSYEVQVSRHEYVSVEAKTRAEAAAKVRAMGHQVMAVNMVG